MNNNWSNVKVDVGVCTFRRQSLFSTLDSIAAQVLAPNVSIRVIVADNDIEPTLRRSISDYAEGSDLNIDYVHAPSCNISVARNACLEAACGEVLLFIDDDEHAAEDWVASLLTAARDSGNPGVVFGPSHAIYPAEAPEWMRANRFHSNIPTAKKEVVETGFSCNVLLDLRVPEVRKARFDPAFGRTGGEDVDFFFRLHRQGVPMAICQNAIVYEPVSPSRMSFSAIVDKSKATGVIYGFCESDGQRTKAVRFLVRSGVKSAYCGLRAVAALSNRTRCAFWVIRSSFHYGVAQSFFMKPTQEFYGEK